MKTPDQRLLLPRARSGPLEPSRACSKSRPLLLRIKSSLEIHGVAYRTLLLLPPPFEGISLEVSKYKSGTEFGCASNLGKIPVSLKVLQRYGFRTLSFLHGSRAVDPACRNRATTERPSPGMERCSMALWQRASSAFETHIGE